MLTNSTNWLTGESGGWVENTVLPVSCSPEKSSLRTNLLTFSRPLPAELVKYAREDTHYLLYIYDKMKNELLDQGNQQKNLLLSTIQRSTQICAQVVRLH